MSAMGAETLRRRLVEELVSAGTLTEDWRAAFEAVPRHAFVPDLTWRYSVSNGGWGFIPHHRADDPDGWLSAAYQDDSVITQVDDGDDCSDDEFSVRQRGPRRLWDEIRAAHTWWIDQGRPDEQDWVFTVHPDGQSIDLPTTRNR